MRYAIRILLALILVVSVGIIGYRVVYDFHLIWKGDTIVVKKSSPDGYDYLLRIPRGYNDFSGPQPLLIFLHGAGNRGTDPLALQTADPVAYSNSTFKNEETNLFPFIVVSPICPEKRWEPARVITLLDQILAENRFRFTVDPDRVYLTGYSMGGFGTVETAMEFPDRFAAIAPVAGGGDAVKAEKLLGVPAWFFHGGKDDVVPLPSAELLVDAMQKSGHRDVTLTVYPHAGHRIVHYIYARNDLYRWLLLKRRGNHSVQDYAKASNIKGAVRNSLENTPENSASPEHEGASLDHGAGGDPSDLVDRGPAEEGLADPVVPEQLHPE